MVTARLKALAKSLAWPDVYFAWALRAWRVARNARYKPDVIVASTGPFSALLLGAVLARRFRSPLIVDYRDLLATGPNYRHGELRRALDLRIEKAAVSNAALVIGVSQHMVDELKDLHSRPTALIMNGYDPKDFLGLPYDPDPTHLSIVHCGTFYPGKRDSSPLFLAIRSLIDSDPTVSISVELYGRNVDEAFRSAEEAGVRDVITYHGQVEHHQSLRIQAQADLLLLLLWNDPKDASVLSGKLFEYMGAQRPIVMLGYESGAAADLVRDNNLGIATNEITQIRDFLSISINEKRTLGHVRSPQTLDLSHYTRRSQSKLFLEFLQNATRRREEEESSAES